MAIFGLLALVFWFFAWWPAGKLLYLKKAKDLPAWLAVFGLGPLFFAELIYMVAIQAYAVMNADYDRTAALGQMRTSEFHGELSAGFLLAGAVFFIVALLRTKPELRARIKTWERVLFGISVVLLAAFVAANVYFTRAYVLA